jgi:hypothetical protein
MRLRMGMGFAWVVRGNENGNKIENGNGICGEGEMRKAEHGIRMTGRME